MATQQFFAGMTPMTPTTTTAAARSVVVPYNTVWPCFPLTLPYYEVIVPGPPPAANAGVMLPSGAIPCYYNAVVEKPSPTKSRMFFLDRSVFDLVAPHQFLSLTDPKLLGWYLGLSAEERNIIQDEGGFPQFLQRHPALELSAHHVYVKHDTGWGRPVQPTITCNKQKLVAHSAYCEMMTRHISQKMTPEHLAAYNGPIAQEPGRQAAHRETRAQVSRLNEEADPAVVMSISLDMELERCRNRGSPELRGHVSKTPGHGDDVTDVAPLQSDCSKDEESPSEFCGFDSDAVDGGDGERSFVRSAEPEPVRSPPDPVEGSAVRGHGPNADVESEAQSDKIHSITEDDGSIIICLTSRELEDGVHSVAADAAEAAKSTKDKTRTTSDRCTSPMPRHPTCDVVVGTELPPSVSASTQSERPQTADKGVITEVHMADLDYLAGVFIKLKAAQEERREKTKSESTKERECVQRAQRAELRLLALQHAMCRQRCRREGDQRPSESSPKESPANVSSALQKLDSDYKRMREKLQEGVPLEQLTPLGVDSEETNTGASFIPAHLVGDVRGNLPSRSLESQECETSGEENGRPGDQSSDGRQESQKQEKKLKEEKSSRSRAAALVPQDGGDAHEPEEKQTKAESCKELNTSESWYDAEEDLEPTETGPDPTTTTTGELAGDEVESSVLCVTNLPGHVTESDVTLWLEKYGASEVSITALKRDLRVAIVTVSGLRSAEAAARELNGFRMDGRTLYVQHVNKPVGGNQNQNQASGSITEPQSSQEAPGPQPPTTKTDREPPLSCSLRSRRVVCVSPTAKATCVPQHYGTMGSFDALMTELTRLHPDAGRQRIVDALVELRAEHRGVLSALPLAKIREMTSERLTRPERDA